MRRFPAPSFRRFALSVGLLLVLGGGSAPARGSEPGSAESALSADELRSDLDQIRELRRKSLEDLVGYLERLRARKPLTGAQLANLHESLMDRRDTIRGLLRYALGHRAELESRETAGPGAVRRLRALGVTLALADTYVEALVSYQTEKHLRRTINEAHSVRGKPENFLRRSLAALLKRSRVRGYAAAVADFARDLAPLKDAAARDDETAYWMSAIGNSYLFSVFRERGLAVTEENAPERIGAEVMAELRYRKYTVEDLLYRMKSAVVGGGSKVFGNLVGLVQWRKGLLYGDEEAARAIRATLRPGDILMERTPFRLTDWFIPGYWGHVAMWLGTENELKELGVWDSPEIAPLQGAIRQGRSIVEALREGTKINAVEHFLDVDDLAVLRVKGMDRDSLKRTLRKAAEQVGKKYDFNFDVETQDTLVCSELVYMTELGIDWRTEPTMGRFTINPDAVAERGEPGRELEVEMLYVHGRRQTGDLSAKMKHVLAHSSRRDRLLARDLRRWDRAEAAAR